VSEPLTMDLCERCQGTGWSGHPDDPAGRCSLCNGTGGIAAEAAPDKIERLRAALRMAEAEARRYASHYPQSSDGRNTFLLLADRIAELAAQGDAP